MRALVLVRNTVSHDARVLRTAATLRDEGFEARIVGVMSTQERAASEEIAGFEVLRLDPRSPMARVRRRLRGGAAAGPVPSPGPEAESSISRVPAPLVAIHRVLTTLDYYRQAAAVVRRERPALVLCNDF